MEIFDREIKLIGVSAFERLQNSSVLLIGAGGVGGAAFQTLVRSGIGSITVCDGDLFEKSNLNRQALSSLSVLGKNKAEAAKDFALSINPNIKVNVIPSFLDPENADKIITNFDYCIDAIDDANAKVHIALMCKNKNIPLIAAMGAGNRLNCDFEITDIYKTKNDPFARIMRKKYREAGIDSLTVVCAKSPPDAASVPVGTLCAVPNMMGLLIANAAVRRLIGFY